MNHFRMQMNNFPDANEQFPELNEPFSGKGEPFSNHLDLDNAIKWFIYAMLFRKLY